MVTMLPGVLNAPASGLAERLNVVNVFRKLLTALRPTHHRNHHHACVVEGQSATMTTLYVARRASSRSLVQGR